MNRFQVSIIAVVIISTIALITYYQYQLIAIEEQLAITLRCDDGVTGKLSISIPAKDAGNGKIEKQVDVAEVCKSGELEIEGYPDTEDVSFEYTNSQGEVARLISQRGVDIFADNGRGYFVIIAIKNTSPYLLNDRI